jgi:amino acid transporter
MSDPKKTALSSDDAVMRKFGYNPQLRRVLSPWLVFGIAFSFMSITTSVYTMLGYGLANFGPASIWFWIIVAVGQLFVALIIAELGSRIPLAGYSYQWGARLLGVGYGWIIAVAVFLYLICCAANIAYVLIAPFLATMFGWSASNEGLLIVALAVLVVTAILNVIGVKLFARINSIAVVAEIVATLVLAIAVLIAFLGKPIHSASFLFTNGGLHGSAMVTGIAGAFAMGLFAMTGFEAAADMSEESVGAVRSVPRAVISALVGTAIIGFIALACFAIATPDVAKVAASYTPVADIMTYWFGSSATRVLLVFPLFAVFGTLLAVIAVAGRLLFALARDNMLPGSGRMRVVHARTKTPVFAIGVGTVASIIILVYAYLQSSAFVILVGAISIVPCIVYLLLVIGYAIRRRSLEHLQIPGAYSLGRWSTAVFVIAVVWLVFSLGVLTIPSAFHAADRVVVVILAAGVVWYFAALYSRVRAKRAGVDMIDKSVSAEAAPAEALAGEAEA